MRRSLTLFVAATLVAGCGSAATTVPGTVGPPVSAAPSSTPTPSPTVSPSSASASSLSWVPVLDYPALEQATLDVPLDYSQPDGPKVTLMLARFPATDQPHRIGSIVFNPGGPGGSGIQALQYGAEALFTAATRARFDIVSFDPRGVGASIPRVHCQAGTFSGPATAKDAAAWTAEAGAFAEACEANSGELLPHVGTPDVVQDLERIREVLGDDRLTYVGQSYGTVIGALYADRYPTRVRAMILDAALDPAADPTTAPRQRAGEAQRLLDDFLAACSKDTTCAFHSDGHARTAFDELMARFEQAPIGGLTEWEARLGTYLLLYSTTRADLAKSLAAAATGVAGMLGSVAHSVEDADFVAATNAVSCLDTDIPRDAGWSTRTADALTAVSPDFGRVLAYLTLCPLWPVPAAPVHGAVHAPGAPPILVIGSTGDPATPYPWSVSLAKQLASGALLTRAGLGHGSLGLGDACIDAAAQAYLIDLKVPAAGLVCQ